MLCNILTKQYIMNKRLQELYAIHWPNLTKELNEILNNEDLNQKPTNPLLLSIDETKYLESDVKVMILGQETNDWGNNFTGNIDEILEIYDDFYNSGYAVNTYGGHFWNGINRFSSLLENKFPDKKISYVWNNVVKIGASGRDQNHPQNHIYSTELSNFKVLEKEIEILNPDIILFISGPNYDTNISKILKGVQFSHLNEGFSTRQIAELQYNKRKNIFRTYHPNYLWRNDINQYFEAIINSIKL